MPHVGAVMKSSSRIKIAATVASVVRASTRPGAPGLTERAQAVPRLVRATRDGSYAGTTVRRLALVGAAVAYVVSPIDFLPEAILPILGAADDAVVISWAIKAFLEETDRFIAWEMGQGLRRPPETGGFTFDAMPRRGSAAAGSTGTTGGRAALGSSTSRQSGSSGSSGPTGQSGQLGRAGSTVRGAATDYVLESVRKRLER